MVLNNYWKAIQSLGRIYGSSGNFSSGMVNISGDSVPNLLTYVGGSSSAGLWQIRTNKMGVLVGSGTTEPTAEDYRLENDVTSSFSNVSVSDSLNATENGLSQVFTVGGDNLSGDEITITEVGITKTYSGQNEVSDSSTQVVLFARIVLDTPVVVPNNGSFQIPIQWLER